MAENLSYVAEQVRMHDPDRFLLSMMMPAACRADLLTLFAFHHEIAKTREVVSETQLGLIRLQWWRDAIARIYDAGEVLEHEILLALADVIARRDLSRQYFEELIYGREFDLEDVLPAHLDGLLSYCDFTSTPLMKLVLQIMGDDPEGGEPVQPAAVNYALVGLMRAAPFHAVQRRCYLPQDLMQKHEQSVNKLYEMKRANGFTEIIKACMEYFDVQLRPQNRFMKASQILAEIYAAQIRSLSYDVFDPKMSREPACKALRLIGQYYIR